MLHPKFAWKLFVEKIGEIFHWDLSFRELSGWHRGDLGHVPMTITICIAKIIPPIDAQDGAATLLKTMNENPLFCHFVIVPFQTATLVRENMKSGLKIRL
jgi:hypothetical protein